jgi:hypothetical protein
MNWQMCQNDECEQWREPTKLKGGCDCGEALVPYLPKEKLTVREMACLMSAVATADPDLSNMSVEQCERALLDDSHMQRRVEQKVGRSEAEGSDLREVLRMAAG